MRKELKASVARILSDLAKADKVISIDEVNRLEEAYKDFHISDKDRADGYALTLQEATKNLAHVTETYQEFGDRILKAAEEISMKDDECSRSESLFIATIEYVCRQKGRVVSLRFRNRPLLNTQLIYVEDQITTPGRNQLDTDFREIERIVRFAGMELVYIPKVAESFRDYQNSDGGRNDDIQKVIQLVAPQSNKDRINWIISTIQRMNSKYFYNNVIQGMLDMDLGIKNPTWVIRLSDSVVHGQDYANFLCFDVQKDIKQQLRDFTKSLNARMSPYSVIVNNRKHENRDFLYSGFYKVLLDVMSTKEIEAWELKVRLYGTGVSNFEYKEGFNIRKCSLTIKNKNEEYPVPMASRELAFYFLIICASIIEGGLNFKDASNRERVITAYSSLYGLFSRRDDSAPLVWEATSRAPMKSNVCNAIQKSEIANHSSLVNLYTPFYDGERISVDIVPDKILVEQLGGDRKPETVKITESELFQQFKDNFRPELKPSTNEQNRF